MTIRKGDKFLCTEDVNNVFGMPLFKKGEVYETLCFDNEQVKTLITLCLAPAMTEDISAAYTPSHLLSSLSVPTN